MDKPTITIKTSVDYQEAVKYLIDKKMITPEEDEYTWDWIMEVVGISSGCSFRNIFADKDLIEDGVTGPLVNFRDAFNKEFKVDEIYISW